MKLKFLFAAGALAWCASAHAAEPTAGAPSTDTGPLPIEAFYAEPNFDCATLSPDSKLMAFVFVQQTDKGKVSVIEVQHLDTGQVDAVSKVATKGMSVAWLSWKNDNRLLVGMNMLDIKRSGDKPNSEIVSIRYGNFIVAIDRDGKNAAQLFKPTGMFSRSRGSEVSLANKLEDDPDHVLAVAPNISGISAVYKVDIHTGVAVQVEPGQSDVRSWMTDSTGAIVARTRDAGDDWVIEGRAPGQTTWTRIARLNPKDLKALDEMVFLGAAEKPSEFYVAAKSPGGAGDDIRQLRIYDVATKTLSEPIWPKLSHDLEEVVYEAGNTGALSGVCYTTDIHVCEFKDKFLSANYRGIVKFFNGDQNVTPISMEKGAPWWLFDVSGPSNPGSYYLFDTAKAKISVVADRYQKLPSERLGVTERFSYKSRDGAVIPAYVTRPPAAPDGPLPLVVMPHGGPEVRDALDYQRWTQILATRGYLVLQPNYRGSGGYGAAYAEAGYKQWGGRMADDITDGVRALIDAGKVDPKRICIFGASYGGYAALFAGATHPELYKCVVSWAGDADLVRTMGFEERTYGRESGTYRYWLKSIGDPDKDAALLRAASPATYAAKYQPDVLLIHGDADRTVDPEQSKIMQAALTRANRKVKLVMFADEAHTDWEPQNEKAAITMVVDFIKAHIAPAPVSTAH